MKTLESENENKSAVTEFRRRISEIAKKFDYYEWGFPNGDRVTYPTYSIETHLGYIQIGVPESWTTKIPHLIRFEKMGSPSPDVEINIPLEHDRRVSGLYVKSGSDYLLCSRGSFNAFRGQIKHEESHKYFDKWLIEVEDKDKKANVIPICSLSSPTISDDIASFVHAVLELKKIHKLKLQNPNDTIKDVRKNPWIITTEFEGKKINGNGSTSEYEYLHGPICNRLINYLKKALSGNQSQEIIKNQHVDAAITDAFTNKAKAIFEVKTASLPSAQVYSAIGQLHYYKFVYGDENTKLILVLPSNCRSETTEIFLKSLNIITAYEISNKFQFYTGENISTIV